MPRHETEMHEHEHEHDMGMGMFCPMMIVKCLVGLVIIMVLVYCLWMWIMPDIFPGWVAQGIIAGTISWYTSFKLAVLISICIMGKKMMKMRHYMMMREKCNK